MTLVVLEGGLTPRQRYSWCILQPHPIGQCFDRSAIFFKFPGFVFLFFYMYVFTLCVYVCARVCVCVCVHYTHIQPFQNISIAHSMQRGREKNKKSRNRFT